MNGHLLQIVQIDPQWQQLNHSLRKTVPHIAKLKREAQDEDKMVQKNTTKGLHDEKCRRASTKKCRMTYSKGAAVYNAFSMPFEKFGK